MSSTFSDETQQQAAVFDQIGPQYEAVFGSNPTQRTAVDWLIQRLPVGARVLDLGAGIRARRYAENSGGWHESDR